MMEKISATKWSPFTLKINLIRSWRNRLLSFKKIIIMKMTTKKYADMTLDFILESISLEVLAVLANRRSASSQVWGGNWSGCAQTTMLPFTSDNAFCSYPLTSNFTTWWFLFFFFCFYSIIIIFYQYFIIAGTIRTPIERTLQQWMEYVYILNIKNNNL